MSSNTLHLSHPLDVQEHCSACLPWQPALPEPVLSGAKCFVPCEARFEASSTSESTTRLELSSYKLGSMQGEKKKKKVNRKIIYVKTGSLLLVTIPNMWHLREKRVPVVKALSAPVAVSSCCCPSPGPLTFWWLDAVHGSCWQPAVTLSCPICLPFSKIHPLSVG